MFQCLNCGYEFKNPKRKVLTCSVGKFPAALLIATCPKCDSDFIKEVNNEE